MKTLAVDFDGVVVDDYDAPQPGAIEGLRFLLTRYFVYILTARDVGQVSDWLEGHDFNVDRKDNGSPTWQLKDTLLVTNRKIDAAAYLDDKAIRFWTWSQAVQDLEVFA